MRIIHTADWHIGQTLAGYARDHEHRAVLASLARIAEEREADALVIAGDIFEHQNPSGEAQRLFYETLVALKRARPSMTIVVIAGNHDAAGRLEAPRVLLEGLGVHVVGSVRRVNGRIVDAVRHLIPLAGVDGEIAANVLAVSHPTAACLPPFGSLAAAEGTSPVVQGTRELYATMMHETGAGRDGLPLVVTGHLHVAGGTESDGAERRILVGGQHAVPASVFPDEAAYVALGHLHKAQKIASEKVRYSGSLMPLSASEIDYSHGVILVSLDGSRAAAEHVDIPRPVEFLRLPKKGAMHLDELGDHLKALDLPKEIDAAHRPFVSVRISQAGAHAGARAEIDQIASKFPVRVVDSRIVAPEAAAAREDAEPIVRLTELDPEDLFRKAFEKTHKRAPEAAHLDAFHRAAAEAAEGA